MASVFSIEVDELTLARARRGESSALEGLYRTFEVPVYTLARRMCHCDAEAADVLQDTFLEAFDKVHQFRGDAPFWAWLRRIAVNKVLMRMRKDRPLQFQAEPEAGQDWQPVADPAPRLDMQRDLSHAMERLSDTARAVVWLHDVEGYTHQEIGELMNKSTSFSKSQLARAHLKLRELLQCNNTGNDTLIYKSY